MFDKIEVKKHYIHLSPDKNDKSLPLLVISHGSGGMSDIDLDFARIACANSYQCAIIDHYTRRGIEYQIWNESEKFIPSFEDRAQDILDVLDDYNTDTRLVFGISAGGTAAINCSNQFDKTFTVYPALIAITSQMLKAQNVTIVTGRSDNWTPADQARRFAENVECDLHVIDGYHGFLNPRQCRDIPDIMSLRNQNLDIPWDHSWTHLNFERGIRLEYNIRSRLYTEKLFTQWLT